MKSKDALNNLVDLVGQAEQGSVADKITKYNYKQILEQELEVLDILKKYIAKTGDGGYMLFPYIKGRSKDARKLRDWLAELEAD